MVVSSFSLFRPFRLFRRGETRARNHGFECLLWYNGAHREREKEGEEESLSSERSVRIGSAFSDRDEGEERPFGNYSPGESLEAGQFFPNS